MPTRDVSFDEDSGGFQVADEVAEKTVQKGEIPREIGDYEIRELIGSGGMGQVFLAEHRRMQRMVAIKMLPIERMKDEDAIARFYDEVRAASRLMHPNIVTAFDAGDADGVHYLAMEYVDGETLTKLVAQSGPYSIGEAAAIIRQAALGLLHAHRAGIVHRDVKPSNLMRASDGTVKVLDLGLARINSVNLLTEDSSEEANSQGKKKGRLVGTLPFMSPEQLEDPDIADPRSDIYALGATLFFLLTGRAPFTGDYLDIVYGHRHGDIPDLMQTRDDVDLELANVFSRMMAKSPDERYASLDEVIDDLSDYASQNETPLWLTDLSARQAATDHTTVSGGSTSSITGSVLAIDCGLFYAAAAEASGSQGVTTLNAGEHRSSLLRMAVASDEDRLIFGNEAMDRRLAHPQQLAHCLPMYIGKQLVEREIGGRQCPPEVLMAMLLRRIVRNAWSGTSSPSATVITIPASYDQLHRRSILQASQMAGLNSVRLLSRSIAAVQSLRIEPELESLDDNTVGLDELKDETILFVGVTGQASEVSVFRRDSSRLHQLSTEGHWNTGTLPWLHRLVDLTAEAFIKEHRFDPRESRRAAARLQMACERAMNSMLLLDNVRIKLRVEQKEFVVQISRRHWLQACEDLAVGVRRMIKNACRDASVSLREVNSCVTLGPLMRIDTIHKAVLRGMSERSTLASVDRVDTARGAAACLAAEMPGRGAAATMPPRGVLSQAIGIVVEDIKGRRRILPIIPRGTSLPARTNRRLTVGSERSSMTLSLVESSGIERADWHSLGRYEIQTDETVNRARMIGFEVNVNGLLAVRAQAAGAPASNTLPALPKPALSDEELVDWTRWLDQLNWDAN